MDQIQGQHSAGKVAFCTLGCRLNISETGSISQEFVDRGHEVVPFGEEADTILINTCTVTDGADSTCRNLIRKAHKSSPEARIVVVGCYAQMEPKAIAEMKGVDLILGNSEKHKVFEYLEEEERQKINIEMTNEFWGAATTPSDGHTRAFLKIQDGCNYICSFCIIPFARGRARAIKIADALLEADRLVESGFKEIVLTGVNIGEYENAHGETLSELVSRVFAVEGVERVRLSSVEPNTYSDELLNTLASSPKFMNHFHIPLQSGDDDILCSMRRKYSVADYREIVEKVVALFPDASIGADMIVGYPGETEEQFLKTYDLVKELPITHFHVFPYSKRKGTMAARMDDHIHNSVKKERVKRLFELGEEKLLEFSGKMVGKRYNVLFETCEDGFFEGYTPNYVKVKVASTAELKNQTRDVYITEMKGGQLFGEIVS